MPLLALLLPLALLLSAPSQGDKTDSKAKLTEKEQTELKNRRDLADAFLRKVSEAAMKNLESAVKGGGLGKAQLAKDQAALEVLQKRLSQSRYFASGTKLEELLEFQAQVKEADRLGVQVNEQALKELIKASAFYQVDDKTLKRVEEEVRKQNGNATSAAVLGAVRHEFRARIIRELNAKKKK